MDKYDSYKDSGVEWIGVLPSHWEVNKLKNLGEVIIGLSYQPENIVDDDNSGTLVMRSSNIQNGKPDFNDNVFVNSQISEKLRTKSGDILICSRNGSRNLIGKNCLITPDIEGMTWGVFMTVYRSKFNRFIYWLLNSQVFESQSGLYLTSTINQLTVSTLENMTIPYTRDENEQNKIVQYLDTKTNLIDTLIQKTQEKIKLLREKRTSLINHTVTKGLNLDVEMKDSGVEWIGEIPKHWEITKVKYQFNVEGGGTPSKEKKEYWDGDIPWVSPKDMKSDEIVDSEDKITELGLKNSTSKLIQPNSLLIVVRSGILQRTIPISINQIPVSINQDLKSLTTKNDFPIKFTYYFIKGNEINLLKDWSKEGTTVESIEMEFMTNSTIPFPPKIEQTLIIEYLEEQTKRIDTLVQKEEKRIELLKEYRQTLISDVVTGKIKVTDYE